MFGQCSRRWALASSIVIPSTPGPPLLLRTRFHALTRFPRAHTSSISCSSQAGLSGVGFAPAFGDQGQRVLDVLPRSTHELPILLAALDRSGLGPSFPDRPICCYAFRPWSASIASPTA